MSQAVGLQYNNEGNRPKPSYVGSLPKHLEELYRNASPEAEGVIGTPPYIPRTLPNLDANGVIHTSPGQRPGFVAPNG